ncbi:MAG: hypothetical protein KDB54_12450 [Solirubrobacterales bacterium]|nr:hypothetical protein [Solirubrobacterales bacterium]HRV59108.1 hypothetical protein [Solirubrobacterales bacterium]
MGDHAYRTFARIGAVLGLAAITAVGFAGSSTAAPADRGDDPVVLKGSQLARLTGAAPGKVVGFKWNGKWIQVPVQIDERHTVSARTLYPADADNKYILGTTFDIEVYADPKTRSGADENSNFDADDELVFMGGDSGKAAPTSAVAPAAVAPGSATRVAVDDPVGGGKGYVYLFRSTGNLDPSAGKDYVDYDFKLTKLTSGQNMKDDYGYVNATNPEDSTVTTDSYQLHSTGRWMEDEMKISAGGASDADILDREAVSAGSLNSCGRSEYTFSGNWDLDAVIGNERPDDDDEGTYVAVIDGPVRAVRDFMGANSGPYVESIHKYYADREDKAINVRVHPIPYMYVWTDYSEAAVGMTYRDQLNTGGVTVDGSPDAINSPAPGDVEDGQYFWQQLSGSQGSVTTLVSAQASVIDGDNPPYAGYYLDDVTPTGSKEKQCGGDLKAYGASGFGIDGTFPNTDPNLAPIFVNTRDLSVNRVRYFGGPDETATEAEALRNRVQQPLTGTASKASVKAPTENLKLAIKGKKPKARPGKALRLKVKLSNSGNTASSAVKVCLKGGKLSRRACKTVSTVGSGKAKLLTLKSKVRKGVRGKRIMVTITARSSSSALGRGVLLRVKH